MAEEFENLEKADGGLLLINVKQQKSASAIGRAKLAVTKLELKWHKSFYCLMKDMPGHGILAGLFFFLGTGTQARISTHVKLTLRALVGKDIVSDIRMALATYLREYMHD